MEPNAMNMENYRQSQNRSAFPAETPVGMSYVPFQEFQPVYDPDTALNQGTIFPDLDKPWLGSKAFANIMMNSPGFSGLMGQRDNNAGIEGGNAK